MNFIQPKHLAEANIQAEIYRKCKNLLIECYLQYKHNNCRFDIVIVNKNIIVGIVEVKKAHHTSTKKEIKKQRVKYSQFGVPIHFCFCAGDIAYTMKVIFNWINNSNRGVRVEQRTVSATYGMTKY